MLVVDAEDPGEALDRACFRALIAGQDAIRGYLKNLPLELELLKEHLKQNEKVRFFRFTRLNRSPRLHFDIELKPPGALRPLQFLHITKCAGTSVENWGHEHGFRWGRFFTKGRTLSLKKPHENFLKGDIFHVPPSFFTIDPYEGSDLFTVVRNPYTRAISEFRCPWYGYCSPVKSDPVTLKKREENETKRSLSSWLVENTRRLERRRTASREDLNSWLMTRAAKGSMRPPYRKAHLMPQSLYLQGVNHILYFENLADDFVGLCKKYGFSAEESILGQDNTSEMPAFTVSDLYPSTIDMLNEMYALDFKHLNYNQF